MPSSTTCSRSSIAQVPAETPIPAAAAAARRCTLYTNVVILVVLAFALSSYRSDLVVILRGKSREHVKVLDQKKTYYHHSLPQSDVGEEDGLAATTSRMPGRFPQLGTNEFREQCSWTSMPSAAYRNCTVFMTPKSPDEHEGISQWAAEVVMSYMLARMGHCQLYVDYGPNVEIHSVLVPAVDSVSQDDTISPLLNDWRVPDGFICRKEEKCITERFEANFPPDSIFNKPPDMLTSPDVAIGPIPRYRFAMQYDTGRLWRDDYNQTVSLLPGFSLETGMACSLGILFQLSPDIARYDNDGRLFAEFLPMLRNNPAVALYIRTENSKKEENTGHISNQDDIVDAFVRTTLELERKYFAGELMLGGYGNSGFKPIPKGKTFVWLVISDDEGIKERIANEYDGQSIVGRVLQENTGETYRAESNQVVLRGKLGLTEKQHQRADPNRPKPTVPVEGTNTEKPIKSGGDKNAASDSSSVTRKVLVTGGSRGTSSHLKNGVTTTKDFAEALIDWYLIGESDAVVASSMYSFGVTAALRTARHIYDPLKYNPGEAIQPEQLVYEGSPKADDESKNSVLAKLQSFCSSHQGYKGGVKVEGKIYDLTCTNGDRRLVSGAIHHAVSE